MSQKYTMCAPFFTFNVWFLCDKNAEININFLFFALICGEVFQHDTEDAPNQDASFYISLWKYYNEAEHSYWPLYQQTLKEPYRLLNMVGG